MKRSGIADLPLHGGRVLQWLAERMAKLGAAITEVIVRDYGTSVFLSRLSDPFWFQALGATQTVAPQTHGLRSAAGTMIFTASRDCLSFSSRRLDS